MAGGSPYQELTEGQRQIYRTAAELYQDYLEALRQGLAFKGGMHWKKIRGREYLYRYRDRYGHGESLGPRSRADRAALRRLHPPAPGSEPPASGRQRLRLAGAGQVLPGRPDPPGAPGRHPDLAAPGAA